jgi:hypothetical protein
LKLEENNTLHGFFENYDSLTNNFLLLQIENSQNVMTFVKLEFSAVEKSANNIKMSQYREVVHINISENGYNVPIDSFKFYISGNGEKEKFVGIA